MDPFAMAAEDLAASDLGTDAVYQFVEGGPEFPVRLIRRQPERGDTGGYGRPGRSGVSVEAMIAAAAVAPGRPQRGDLIGIGSERGYRVENVEQSAEGAMFILSLSRQD